MSTVAEAEKSDRAADDPIRAAVARLSGPVADPDTAAACLQAVNLLEQIPLVGDADSRIQLAWHVTNALLYDQAHADTCARALLATFPADGQVKDRIWERRWLTALAVIERIRGNVATSLKAEAASLELAQEIGDLAGQSTVLSNLAALAVLGGRFEEALQIADFAIRTSTESSTFTALANALVIRGNALLYLGRYDEALQHAYRALAVVGPVTGSADKRRAVMGRALAAEALLGLSRVDEAALVVSAVEMWATESGAAGLLYEARRVRALLDVALGETERGLASLRQLRDDKTKSPILVLDLLQSEYRARLMARDSAGALHVLEEVRAFFVEHTEQTLKGLGDAPSLTRYLPGDRRVVEIDRYLESKRLLTRIATPVSNSWDYLVALAASSIAPEDPTLEHGLRVGRLSALVAKGLGASHLTDEVMVAAGLVHDVGKVGIPPEVLVSSEPLAEPESALFDTHAETGAQLLDQADFPHKRSVINATRYHHCSYDGIGSRSTLIGDSIPLEARIIAVCDAFDGMLMGRPRRPAQSVSRALEELLRRSGRDFDPAVVSALVEACRRLPNDATAMASELSSSAEDIPYFASRRAIRRAAITRTSS